MEHSILEFGMELYGQVELWLTQRLEEIQNGLMLNADPMVMRLWYLF